MSLPGRPKGEYRSATHEGTPVSADHSPAHMPSHDDHAHDDVGYHASVKGYVIGFLLSVVLTAIPFWLVMGKVLPTPRATAFVILAFAAVQMIVHMIYFLHMNAKVEGGWSLLALTFTVALVVIMLAGSIWVMYHLNTNMMPTMDPQTMRNMP
jgi:cytochrome o ubiquinol oxidase operon protein cyoD